ncbi:FAD/NAD(P)-binding domain-containing protein [Gonapodya prolifera JEL478]|uniref:FAD/NAD(P)-binding domain-containing protein n=1 Tax=Gonapodya prolifera (strain JEL478) TaxID=1344416 RepID=A0A139AJ66_GONPJ|nr:FAD/NAD(P)-binding domain-containing protein [Gonapodya prolifera JEL478]|eukprot:KXS16604.1 FAD/NAD(P)-binding domain-containing protein [Gonapodya prolifera JEL478]
MATFSTNGVAFYKPPTNTDEYNVFSDGPTTVDDNSHRSTHLASTFDVAIVGYGPVGGFFANLLALQGHSVVLVEQSPHIYDKPRAIVLDHEALRVLQMIGLGKEIAGMISNHAGTTFIGLDGEPIKHFDPLPPPYPLAWFPTVMFIQPEMEQFLRDRGTSRFLRTTPDRDPSHGVVEVLLEHRVVGLDEDAGGVTVHVKDITGEAKFDKNMLDVVSATSLKRPAGAGETSAGDALSSGKSEPPTGAKHEEKQPFSIRAKFVIGADGGSGNSFVRKSLRIPYDSLDFDEWWIVIDTWLQRPAQPPLPPKSRQYCWPHRPGTFIIGPRNLRRWEIKLLPGEDPAIYSDPVKGLDRIKNLLGVYVEDVDAVDVWRAAVYRFHALVARKWTSERGRVFLAGDAGLCAGIRDSVNLSWKLSHMLRHPEIEPSSTPLLGTYQRERAPHVTTIVGHGKSFGLIIGELDLEKAKARDAEMRRLMAEGKVSSYRQAFIPDLDGGCVAEGDSAGGKLFPQPLVSTATGEKVKMDDALLHPRTMSWLIVAKDIEALDWLSSSSNSFMRSLGAQRIVVHPVGTNRSVESGSDTVVVEELEGVLAAWFEKYNARVAVVRPDRCYAYGAAQDEAGLNGLIEGIRKWLTN